MRTPFSIVDSDGPAGITTLKSGHGGGWWRLWSKDVPVWTLPNPEGLKGRFNQHHPLMIQPALDHVEHLEAAITTMDERVDEVISPFTKARDHLATITGVGKRAAECIMRSEPT